MKPFTPNRFLLILTVLVLEICTAKSIFAQCYNYCADDYWWGVYPSGEGGCSNNPGPGWQHESGCWIPCLTATCSDGRCCGAGGGCFLPGTKVATPGGEAAIETLKKGSDVMGFDENTASVSAGKVAQNYSLNRDSYYVIKTESGKEVKVTAEHPFYTGTDRQPALTLTQKIQNLWYRYTTYLKSGWSEVKNKLVIS